MRIPLAIAALGLAACAQPTPPETPDGVEGGWFLETLDGADVAVTATLNVDEGEVFGVAPCNRYRGGLSREGDRVAVGPIVATRAICADMAVEDRFLGGLTDAASMATEGDALIVRGADGAPLMTFRRSA